MTVAHDSRVVVVGQGYVGLPLAMRAVEVGHDGGGLRRRQGPGRPAAQGRQLHRRHHRRRPRAPPWTPAATCPPTTRRTSPGSRTAVVCVPTPLRDGAPNLSFIEDAARLLAPHLRRGACVVLESTTYPGTTEEVFVPILEAGSGLRAGVDFHARLQPGANRPEQPDVGSPEHAEDRLRGRRRRRRKAVAAFYGTVVDRTVAGARHPGGRAGEAAGEHLPARQHRARQRAGRSTATSSASTSGR